VGIRSRLRKNARAAAFAALTAGTLGAWYPLTFRKPDERDRRPIRAGFRVVFTRGVLELFGVEAEIVGGPAPRTERGRLVIANHRSALDIPLVAAHAPGVFLSRGDVGDMPLLGTFAREAGTLFVDREDQGSRASAVRMIRSALKEGETVIVFAEGTTFSGDEVRPFHPGAFLAARGLDVDVLSAGLAYADGAEYGDETFAEHLARIAARPRTKVALVLGEPEPLPKLKDVRDVAEHFRGRVQGLVGRARAKVGK